MPESEKAAETLREVEETTSYIVNVSGKTSEEEAPKKVKSSVPFSAKLPMIICGLGLAALPLIFSALTVLYPFHLAINASQKVMDFFGTIKDKIVAVFTDEYLKDGEVPDDLSERLKEEGIICGTETEGEGGETSFFPTNHIFAYIGSEYIVAATDGTEYRLKAPATGSSSELKVQFKGKTYNRNEFLTALETNDELYMAFDKAVGGDSLFFYDRSGEGTFADLGINRDPYHDFEEKVEEYREGGDSNPGEAAFRELFSSAVDYNPDESSSGDGSSSGGESGEGDGNEDDWSDLFGGGEESGGEGDDSYDGELDDGDWSETPSEDDPDPSDPGDGDSGSEDIELTGAKEEAETYIRNVAKNTKAASVEEATKKAAALLNAAISASEPYQSSRAAAAVLIAAEQAKAGYGGPINEMANMITASYPELENITDESAEKKSASDSENLSAIVTDIDFSAEAAKKYSRDRVSIKGEIEEEGKEVTVSVISGFKKLINWIVGFFGFGGETEEANADALVSAYKTDIAKALFVSPSSKMKGEELGERITEGASFINVNLTKNAGGANASDSEAVAVYSSYVKKLYDRRVAAERSTKSPFDLTSPNTFFGSIVNNIYSVGIGDATVFGKFAKLGSLTAKSFGKLTLGTYADGLTSTYLGTSGECPTVGAINAEGDIYCNQKTSYDITPFSNGKTIITATLADYSGDLKPSGVDNNGKIEEGSEAADYINLNAGRGSTPGVKDANVCENKKRSISTGNFFRFLFSGSSSVEASCEEVPEDIATGERYANSSSNSEWNTIYKNIQGYYLEVYARELTGYYKDKENPILAFKAEQAKKYPKDTSLEGIIAYRTGLSKADVIAGIEAIKYLAYLEDYDPSSRLAFFEKPEEVKISIEESLVFSANYSSSSEPLLAEKNKIVFDEKRNRVVLI